MNKKLQIQFLLEYIAQSTSTPKDIQKVYLSILQNLETHHFYTPSIFTCKQIEQILQDRSNIQIHEYETAKYHLYKLLESDTLKEEKKSILHSLLASNFKAHAQKLQKSKEDFEASLSKVEAKMYKMISLYIELLLIVLDSFMLFLEQDEKDVETITAFAISTHEILMKNIFYKEEQEHIETGLKQLSVVYISLYCKEHCL